ncbi:MAG: hypothetical protein WAZ27_04155 [Minisyncoccia bacterium]
MHERHPFSTRGGSLVGAVLVVALLSAAAITLDASKMSVNQNALLAQGSSATPTTSVAPSSEAKAVTGKCEIGYDYVVKIENRKPAISFAAWPGDAATKDTSRAQRCASIPGAPRDGTGTKNSEGFEVRWCQSRENAEQVQKRDPLRKDWECKVRVCKIVGKKQINSEGAIKTQDAEVCFVATKAMKVGEALDAENVVKKAEAGAASLAADPALTPQEREEAKGFASTGSLSSSDDLLGVWKDEQKENDAAIATQKESIRKSEENLTALTKGYENCSSSPSIPDEYNAYDSCGTRLEQLKNANEKLALDQKKLEELEEQKVRLSALQKSLTPGDAQPPPASEKKESQLCPGGPGCGGGEWNPNTGRLETTFKKDDRDNRDNPGCTGPLAFLCRNTGQPDSDRAELYAACQAGNQRACQAYVGNGSGGVGAYGGYGGAYSSGGQPCSAQQQQSGILGIITTITSLFGKGNSASNCGNGNGSDAPLPTCRITASPTNIPTGSQPVTLTWQSEKAFSATLSNSGNVSTQGSMTVNPQTTTTYTLSLGGYVDNRTGQQLRGECSTQVTVGTQGGGSGDGAVKAEISCRPQVADVGMSVAVSFACRNANTSVGSGFSSANQMSGSATPVVAQPTIGSDSVTYGLTCSKEGKTDTAQCTVEINKTSIVLIANPKNLESGKESNIGWITSGMEACTISSPTLSGFTAENAGSTNVSGVAKSPPLTADTKFVLSCTTKAGGTKTAETTVTVGN